MDGFGEAAAQVIGCFVTVVVIIAIVVALSLGVGLGWYFF